MEEQTVQLVFPELSVYPNEQDEHRLEPEQVSQYLIEELHREQVKVAVK